MAQGKRATRKDIMKDIRTSCRRGHTRPAAGTCAWIRNIPVDGHDSRTSKPTGIARFLTKHPPLYADGFIFLCKIGP